MYLSLRWIEKFVKLPALTAEELALKVTMSTVEVEGVIKQAQNLDGIVVGQIKELVKHPQADRLSICKTSLGSQTVQIICGGSNLREGMLVAVAKVGSRVRWHGEGELVTLESAKIRGQESHGMIVASSEIGLEKLFPAASDHEIIDLSDYNFKPGASLAESLNLTDTILEIDNKSMTHRPDLWGQYGLARELAAIFDVKCKPLRIPAIVPDSTDVSLTAVVDPAVCQRFTAVAVDDVVVGPSPWWLRKALESVGLNSINTIVDITNFVMMELGHPMHAFDRSAVDGSLHVKTLTKAETLVTLDQVKRKLEVGTPVIVDSKKALDIAGIIGGEASGIKANTTSIILTCANFPASLIRRTSVKQNIRTEASARYEKALDPTLAPQALALAVQMIRQLMPTARVSSKVVDIDHSPDYHRTIIVPKEMISSMIGMSISDKQVKDILQRLQFGVRLQAKAFEVTVPSWRATKDITIPQDLVEEVARIYGYDNVVPELPPYRVGSGTSFPLGVVSGEHPLYGVHVDVDPLGFVGISTHGGVGGVCHPRDDGSRRGGGRRSIPPFPGGAASTPFRSPGPGFRRHVGAVDSGFAGIISKRQGGLDVAAGDVAHEPPPDRVAAGLFCSPARFAWNHRDSSERRVSGRAVFGGVDLDPGHGGLGGGDVDRKASPGPGGEPQKILGGGRGGPGHRGPRLAGPSRNLDERPFRSGRNRGFGDRPGGLGPGFGFGRILDETLFRRERFLGPFAGARGRFGSV
jgi:tRNA-binding EMAP/Myf-like protein